MALRKLATIPPRLLIGPKGLKGDTGEQGPQGPKGDPGQLGPQGEAGTDGKPGPAGTDGQDGKDGSTPIPQWEGTRLHWKVDGKLIKGPDLQGPEGEKGRDGESGGGGGGAAAQTEALYAVTVASASLGIGTDSNRVVLVDATSGDVTVTMPKAGPAKGLVYHVKKTDSSTNKVIIQPQQSQLIDGEDCFEIVQTNTNLMIVSDGSAWYVV